MKLLLVVAMAVVALSWVETKELWEYEIDKAYEHADDYVPSKRSAFLGKGWKKIAEKITGGELGEKIKEIAEKGGEIVENIKSGKIKIQPKGELVGEIVDKIKEIKEKVHPDTSSERAELQTALNGLLVKSANDFVAAFKATFVDNQFYSEQVGYFLKGAMSNGLDIDNQEQVVYSIKAVRKMFLETLESEFRKELSIFEVDFKERFMNDDENKVVGKMAKYMLIADQDENIPKNGGVGPAKEIVKGVVSGITAIQRAHAVNKLKGGIAALLAKETKLLWVSMEKRLLTDAKENAQMKGLLVEIHKGINLTSEDLKDVTLETAEAAYWQGTEECIKKSETAFEGLLKANFAASTDFKTIINKILMGMRKNSHKPLNAFFDNNEKYPIIDSLK